MSRFSEDEIIKARNNLLRGTDVESAAIILKSSILDNVVVVGGRVNSIRLATRQILDFVNEHEKQGCINLLKEKVERGNRINKAIEYIENMRQYFSEDLQPDFINILDILTGGEYTKCKK